MFFKNTYLLSSLFLIFFSFISFAHAQPMPAPEMCMAKKELADSLITTSQEGCTQDTDCEIISTCICPFGSYQAMKSDYAEKDEMLEAMSDFGLNCERCLYDCTGISPDEKAVCVENTCQIKRLPPAIH